ncbi:MAG: winged helix-turn-helix domain-containing protein [Myxococcaceae bacterium]
MFRYADCELDSLARTLSRAGREIPIQPKVMDFLLHLIAARNRVVSKEELTHVLWPDVVVGEAALPRVVKLARKAVGDDGDQQQVLRTVHSRGYQFVAPLEERATDGKAMLAEADVLRRSHPLDVARPVYLKAAEAARASGESLVFARAALGYAGLYVRYRPADQTIVSLLEEALRALGNHAPGMRARLLAYLACEFCIEPAGAGRRKQLRQEALALAERSGDTAALLDVLVIPYAQTWELVEPARRRGLALQCIEQARLAGSLEMELCARTLLLDELMSLGELRVYDDELAEVAAVSTQHGDPRYLFGIALRRGALAMLRGDFDHSEQLVDAAFAAGRRIKGMEVFDLFVAQRVALLVSSGRAAEAIALHDSFLSAEQSASARALRAWVHAEAGQGALAHRLLRDLMETDGPSIVDLPLGESNAAVLADVSAELGEIAWAETLYDWLSPLSGRNVQRGLNVCHGPADRFLGRLAVLLGRTADAEQHFQRALALCRYMGTPVMLARTLRDAERDGWLAGPHSSRAV